MSYQKWVMKEGYATVKLGTHERGCGGVVYQLAPSAFGFCSKCNASGIGKLKGARQSGAKRLATAAKRRVS